MQQFFCQTEHAERLLMGVAARTAESGRVEAALVADDDLQAACARDRDWLDPQRRAVRHDRLHRHLEAGPLIERGLLDLERGGTVICPTAGREHLTTRLAHGRDDCRQVPQENRLGHDGLEATTLGVERALDRAVHRGGLSAGIRDVGGRAAMEEDLARCGPFDPTQHDRAAV